MSSPATGPAAAVINAVDGVSVEIPDGCIVGIAGESGCGKSTLMKAIYGDIVSPMSLRAGSIDYGFKDEKGEPITSDNIQRQWFKRISYVPQSSMNSLNPVVRIGDAVHRLSRHRSRQAARAGKGARLHRQARPAGRDARRLSAPAVGRHAPARHDRAGDLLPARTDPRRRADHRARRGGAEGNPAAADGSPGADEQHDPHRLPRHGRALPDHPPHAHHVRGQGGRVRRLREHLPRRRCIPTPAC